MADSGISLMLATFELSAVRMIRGAMRAADAGAAGGPGGVAGTGVPQAAGSNQPRPAARYTPSPHFNPRVVYHPTPRYESRPVLHPTPRYEPRPPCCAPCEPERAPICPSPVVPVWKTLPNLPTRPAVHDIKVHVVRPDIRHKGTLIDTVI